MDNKNNVNTLFENCYKEVAKKINKQLVVVNEKELAIEEICEYIKIQIENFLTDPIGYIEFVESRLHEATYLDIYGRGNPILDPKGLNIFLGLGTLKEYYKNTGRCTETICKRDILTKKMINNKEINVVQKDKENSSNLPLSTKKKGRTVKPFDNIIIGDKEATKEKLHKLLKDRKGASAIIFIKAAIQLGIIQRPTHTQFKNEFGDNIASRSLYNRYLNGNSYSKDELTGAKAALGNE